MDIDPIEHANYFAGYLDAAGRVQSTAEELHAITARVIFESESAEEKLGIRLLKEDVITDPRREFGEAFAPIIGRNLRSPLHFYLVEYFNWLIESPQFVACMNCEVLWPREMSHECVWRLEFCGGFNVWVAGYVVPRNA